MKDKILKWLFSGYAKRLKNYYKQELEAYKESLDIKDLIRSRLNGITIPKLKNNESAVSKHIAGLDEGERIVFLSKARDVINNETFQAVATALIVDSWRESVLSSRDMIDVNFNRATINGITILEDELGYLASIFEEEEKQGKDKMSEDEKFGILS